MGGFLPPLQGDDKEPDSLPPKAKVPVDQNRDFEVNFADLDLPGDFPEFSAVEEWFDNLPPESFDFWSSLDGDCDLGLGGGAVAVKVEDMEGENNVSLGVGGLVPVKMEECEVCDVGVVGGGISGSGEGVRDVEAFVEREMGRVSLGCLNEELGAGDGSDAGQGGLKMVGDKGVSMKSEVDGGNGVVPDWAVPVGSDGVCVKTELTSKDGEMADDSMFVGVVVMERAEKVGDGQPASEDAQGEDPKEGESGSSSDESSSSSSSSDDDSNKENEDNDKVDGNLVKEGEAKDDEGADDMEEGEIREADEEAMHAENKTRESESDADVVDEMVDLSVVDFQTEGLEGLSDDENEVIAGPIMSKNELKVLPPVPSVSVKLEPHHEMVPIGPVLSIVELQVVVEGCLKHNPLNEGSIVWIAESRSPLGFIDEIFGPVKNPYYLIRYNSKAEIPTGIKEGTLVSSVPEYASYVLNQKDLYKKGYDFSGKNDEEVSEDEEFSDDEKEAEYKRMQRMAKRDTEMTAQKPGNRKVRNKKGDGRNPNWNPRPSAQHMPTPQSRFQPNGNQDHPPPRPAPTDSGNSASSSAIHPGSFGGNNDVPPFPFQMSSGDPVQPFNPSLLSGLPLQGPAGAFLLNAISNAMLLPANNALFPAQAAPFPPRPMVPPSQVPFQMGFDHNQNILANLVSTGVQSNPFGNPASAPWSGPLPPNNFNPMGVGMRPGGQLDPNNLLLFANALGIHLGGGQADPNFNATALPSAAAHSASTVPPPPMQGFGQFNAGASSGHGNRPFRRGGGRFSGGRGWGRGRGRSN